MQWYEEKRRRIDIANSQSIFTLSNPKENREFGGFFDSILAMTEKNKAILFDIDINETDCCPDDLYLTPKKKVVTLIANDIHAQKAILRSSIVVSFIVNGTGNLGSENNIKMIKSGMLIVSDEKIDNIDVRRVEIPLKGINIW